MPILPGITPPADYYIEMDADSGRARLRNAEGLLLALYDMSSADGANLLAMTITGLTILAPGSSLYDLSLRRYIRETPKAATEGDDTCSPS